MAAEVPLGAGDNGTRDKDNVAQTVDLLRRALGLLDESEAPNNLAARVQQTIDAVEEWHATWHFLAKVND